MRWVSGIVVVLLLSSALSAPAQSAKDLLRVSKLKAKVESLGPKTPVIVELIGGDTLKGDIADIAGDRFSLSDRKTGVVVAVLFREVKEVRKKPSQGVVGVEIAAGAGAAAGLLYLISFAASKCGPCIGR